MTLSSPSGAASSASPIAPPASADGASTDTPAETPQIRALRRLVMAMTAILCLGMVVLVARIIYLAARPAAQGRGTSAALMKDAALALPSGAEVTSLALDGTRLAVHYRAGHSGGILILDLASGETISRVRLEEQARP